jgi:hypothetical protein
MRFCSRYPGSMNPLKNERAMRVAATLIPVSAAVAMIGARSVRRLRLPRSILVAMIWGLAILPGEMFVMNCVFMPSKYNIRVDLIIYPEMLMTVVRNAMEAMLELGK